MSKKINVAIVGLGRVGSTFLQKLVEHESKGISIAAVSEKDQNTAGLQIAKDKGIKIYDDEKIVDMGEELDIIFDLTGSSEARKRLREAMVRTGNTHTVIAPEIMAFLIWDLISEGGELPGTRGSAGY